MIKETETQKVVGQAARRLLEYGMVKHGYVMLQEPQAFCLVPRGNTFDISIHKRVWDKGTQRKRAAEIALSLLGCNLPDSQPLSPEGVKTTTDVRLDYRMWKDNFKRCYNDLTDLKSGHSSKANSCVFTMVHPVIRHKPCVIYAQFGVYEDNLQLTVNARATHLFMLYENLFRYINLQLLFSSLLQLRLGCLYFMSNNLHVHEDQHVHLSDYLELAPQSKRSLGPRTLTLEDYDRDRRLIRSGKYDEVTWSVFRELIDQMDRTNPH
ncbi:MAG: hypothetical protein SWQ30_02735 [Thermodesulfobacteriota bacterium]|nr:hypothetical protein [Thermodesulfobacteriota bacterium]